MHASVVELNKAGTGFITVTEDSGTVQSVSGNSLTIKEAVGKVVYRTVTLTIPSSATITRNFSKAALSTLKSGDRVRVEQSNEGTEVSAVDLWPRFRVTWLSRQAGGPVGGGSRRRKPTDGRACRHSRVGHPPRHRRFPRPAPDRLGTARIQRPGGLPRPGRAGLTTRVDDAAD